MALSGFPNLAYLHSTVDLCLHFKQYLPREGSAANLAESA